MGVPPLTSTSGRQRLTKSSRPCNKVQDVAMYHYELSQFLRLRLGTNHTEIMAHVMALCESFESQCSWFSWEGWARLPPATTA